MDQILETQIAEQNALKRRIQNWLNANRLGADEFSFGLNERELVRCCARIEALRAKVGLGTDMPSAQKGW